jgi:hypothetical protein
MLAMLDEMGFVDISNSGENETFFDWLDNHVPS